MSWTDKNIIFLISLPRAGSTLLQRILSAHPVIHSSAESWVLLPQFYAMRAGRVFSEYGHTHAAGAIEDFCSALPSGRATYFREVNTFITRLFESATPPGKQYYLEKTPRNALIVDELIQHFPNSKFIFLWRNPLACASSIIETFGKGRWNLFKYTVDLYDGLDNMVEAINKHGERIIQIQYEHLVLNPETCITQLLDNIGLEVDTSLITRFQEISFNGRMGDPTGIKEYTALSTAPLDKWKQTLRSPTRRIWASRYLDWVGTARLAVMGYDRMELKEDLKGIPLNHGHTGSDMVRMAYGLMERRLQLKMFRHLIRTRHNRKFSHRFF